MKQHCYSSGECTEDNVLYMQSSTVVTSPSNRCQNPTPSIEVSLFVTYTGPARSVYTVRQLTSCER